MISHSLPHCSTRRHTQATMKLKRKRLEVQVKDLFEPVALNALIAIGELLV